MEGGSLRVPATSSQFCSVQPLPRGPQSIGSDWTGVGRKASILLCTIVIIDFNPCLLRGGGGGGQREAGGGGGILLWGFLPRGRTNVHRGGEEAKKEGEKKLYTLKEKNPQKEERLHFLYIPLVPETNAVRLRCEPRNRDQVDVSRNI